MKGRRIAFATVALLACGYVVERCAIHPAVVASRSNAFVREHPIGSAARELAAAPFVEDAELLDVFDGPSDAGAGFVAHGAAFALKSGESAITKDAAVTKAGSLTEGTVTFGWTTVRPFGRALVSARIREGRVTQIASHSLD